MGWLQSCIKGFYEAGFSPVQDTAALAVICGRQQAAVIGIETFTRRIVPDIYRRHKSDFCFRATHIFDGRDLNLVTGPSISGIP